MKFLVLLIAISGFAHSAYAASERMVCQEYDRESDKLLNKTVVLTPTGPSKDKLDEKGEYIAVETPYLISIYEGSSTYTEQEFSGHVLSEDVNFNFESDDGKIVFYTYLDEPAESGLVIKDGGKEVSSDFVCR